MFRSGVDSYFRNHKVILINLQVSFAMETIFVKQIKLKRQFIIFYRKNTLILKLAMVKRLKVKKKIVIEIAKKFVK